MSKQVWERAYGQKMGCWGGGRVGVGQGVKCSVADGHKM